MHGCITCRFIPQMVRRLSQAIPCDRKLRIKFDGAPAMNSGRSPIRLIKIHLTQFKLGFGRILPKSETAAQRGDRVGWCLSRLSPPKREPSDKILRIGGKISPSLRDKRFVRLTVSLTNQTTQKKWEDTGGEAIR